MKGRRSDALALDKDDSCKQNADECGEGAVEVSRDRDVECCDGHAFGVAVSDTHPVGYSHGRDTWCDGVGEPRLTVSDDTA